MNVNVVNEGLQLQTKVNLIKWSGGLGLKLFLKNFILKESAVCCTLPLKWTTISCDLLHLCVFRPCVSNLRPLVLSQHLFCQEVPSSVVNFINKPSVSVIHSTPYSTAVCQPVWASEIGFPLLELTGILS